jgi:hypothetical protein
LFKVGLNSPADKVHVSAGRRKVIAILIAPRLVSRLRNHVNTEAVEARGWQGAPKRRVPKVVRK